MWVYVTLCLYLLICGNLRPLSGVFLSILSFEIESLIEPEAHQLARLTGYMPIFFFFFEYYVLTFLENSSKLGLHCLPYKIPITERSFAR